MVVDVEGTTLFAASTLLPTLLHLYRKKIYGYQSRIGYASQMYHGVVYPPFCKADRIDELRKKPLRSDDIVIATYPKCGTTLMQQIVLCLTRGENVLEPMAESPWAEMTVSRGEDGIENFNNWPSVTRRVVKTHGTAELKPWSEINGAKVIVVARNPGDACVSMWHHSRDIPVFKYSGPLNHFVEKLYMPGKVESGCFWAFHAGWRREVEKDPDNHLWIAFEDFKTDPEAVIRNVASFIGGSISEEVIQLTIDASSFDKMKKTADSINAEKKAKGIQFKKNHIREGKKGGWRSKMGQQAADEFMVWHKKKCDEHSLDASLFQFQ